MSRKIGFTKQQDDLLTVARYVGIPTSKMWRLLQVLNLLNVVMVPCPEDSGKGTDA